MNLAWAVIFAAVCKIALTFHPVILCHPTFSYIYIEFIKDSKANHLLQLKVTICAG